MTIIEAMARVTADKPYIQCATQAASGIKLKPVFTDTLAIPSEFEVYEKGVCINKHYRVKPYELQQSWKVVK